MKVIQHNAQQAWVKTTKAQKLAWMTAEEGSYEDSDKADSHVYNEIRGSYWASLYVDSRRLEPLVNSLLTCTLEDVNPRIWEAFCKAFIEVCEGFDNHSLASQIKNRI